MHNHLYYQLLLKIKDSYDTISHVQDVVLQTTSFVIYG